MFEELAKKNYHALEAELIDYVNDRLLTKDNEEDWHHILYNTDYRFIYNYEAKDWFKEQNLDILEVIENIAEWEEDNLGESNITKSLNYSHLGNMVFYIMGEYFLNELDGTIEIMALVNKKEVSDVV